MSFSSYKLFVGLFAGATLAGCAGNGAGLDATGQPISSSGGGTTPLTADFQSIQDHVFTPICSPCHSGASAPEGLMLDAGHSYNLLVGIASNEVPALSRVKAGDPDNSYIVRKLQGGPGIVGSQMPLNQPPLPQATIDVIRTWISNGAPQGTATPAAAGAMAKIQSLGNSMPSAAFSVTQTSPLDNTTASTAVQRIVVAFNHEVDASLINYTTVSLERVALTPGDSANVMGGAAPPVPSYVLPTTAALAQGNPTVIVITPPAPLVTGTYRVSVRGTGGGALADMNVHTLGSDYSFTFNVDASP
jgi:methionine-rich copper-binding protein CopC